jgi:hypothetical protein
MKGEMPDLKQGCGCALIIVAIAVFFSFPTILRLIEKLIDKL